MPPSPERSSVKLDTATGEIQKATLQIPPGQRTGDYPTRADFTDMIDIHDPSHAYLGDTNMRVQQIDLRYAQAPEDALLGARLHVQSHSLTGQEIFREVDLDIKEVRELERLLDRTLKRLTQEALKLI